MSQKMERQKLLYVARTKTAKVIRSTPMKHLSSLPSSASPEIDPHYAPLASVEPELLAATKTASGAPKQPLRGQVRKPASKTNVCSDQVLQSDSGTFKRDHSHKELRDCTPPRTYVKLRATSTPDAHKDNPNISCNRKPGKGRPGQFLSCGLSPSEPKPYTDNDLPAYDQTLPTHGSQNVPRDEISIKATNNSRSTRRIEKKAHKNSQHGSVTIVNRNNVYSAEQKSTTKTPPPVAPKPTKICSKSPAVADSKPNITHSENDPHKSKPNVSPSSVVHNNAFLASKENYIESSQTLHKNTLGMTQTATDKVHSICKPGHNSSKSPDEPSVTSTQARAGTLQDPARAENSSREYSSSTLLPEMLIPMKYLLHERGPLPEMYKVPGNATHVRPKSAQAAVPHASHIFHSRSEPRKPLVAIDTSFNTSGNVREKQSKNVREEQSKNVREEQNKNVREEQSKNVREEQSKNVREEQSKHVREEQSKNARQADQRAKDIQHYSYSDCQHTQINVNYRKQSIDEGFLSIPQTGPVLTESLHLQTGPVPKESLHLQTGPVPKESLHLQTEPVPTNCIYLQTGPIPPESLSILPVTEFRNSWKRNSMRLATHGYTSMSDLTNSVECLTDPQPQVIKNECSPIPTENECSPIPNKCEDNHEAIQTEVYAETSYPKNEESENCDSASVTSEHEITSSDDMCDNHNKTYDPNIDNETLDENIFQEQPIALLERNGTHRLSYRMATSSMTDISILADDMGGHSDKSHQTCVMVRNNKNKRSDVASRVLGSPEMIRPGIDDGARNVPPVVGSLKQQTLAPHRHELEEQGNKLKRLSFTLATSSISDLTFPFVDYGNAVFPLVQNGATNDKSDGGNITVESTDGSSSIFHTPESKPQEGNSSSSGRHSSFGSVYSFRSLDSGKVKSNQDKIVPSGKHQPYYNTGLKDSPLAFAPNVASDSSDSDGSNSGDTTFYYTASSDTSFVTTEGEPVSRQHLSPTTHRLPTLSPCEQKRSLRTLPSQDQTPQRSPSQSQRGMLPSQGRRSPRLPKHDQKSSKMSLLDQRSPKLSSQGHRSPDLPSQDQRQESCSNSRQERLGPRNPHSLTPNEPPSKRSSPTNNVLHGRGDSLNSAQNHWNRNIARTTPSINRNVEKDERPIADPKGNHSNYSTERVHARLSDDSPRHFPAQILTSAEADLPGMDQSYRSSISSSCSFCSLDSSGQDITWEETPRFPPSLGKPRRKLYAGFDSQPLPMDSFISDSSSIYSLQTCSSWGASRSAEVESCSRTTDMTPNIRSVSSIVSSTYAPVRCMSQEEMLDLLKYTDKMFSAGQNSHNIYLDDRFKDNSYDKTFSSESLESFRSDDTVVGVSRQETADDTLEYTKLCVDTKAGGRGMYNNVCAGGYDKTRNERRQLDKLNNSCGLDFGSKLSNNTFVGGNVVNNKNRLKTVKSKNYSQPFVCVGSLAWTHSLSPMEPSL